MTVVRLALVAVWLVGWLLDIHPALRRRMLAEIPVPCDLPNCPNRYDNPFVGKAHLCDPVWRPRGSVRERTGRDAAVAVWNAAWWPVRLLVVGSACLLCLVGDGVGAAVLSAKLTAPELERRIREQSAEINRLTKEIDEGKGS